MPYALTLPQHEARLQYDPSRALISRETYEESVLEQMYGSHIFDEFETER